MTTRKRIAAPPPPASKESVAPSKKKLSFKKADTNRGMRFGIYGPGGIGKTTLAMNLASRGPIAIIDLDDSIPSIRHELAAEPLIVDATTYQDILDALESDGWDDVKTIVVDTVTRLEELIRIHVLETIKTDGGDTATSIEQYGWGKGYHHMYETFIALLSRLDRHVRQGRNVVLIAHECATVAPNPQGTDWERWEPRLQHPPKGKGSIRLALKEWVDALFFYGWSVDVKTAGKRDKVGKSQNDAVRIIWTKEMPYAMAKSRGIDEDEIVIANNEDLPAFWSTIFRDNMDEEGE